MNDNEARADAIHFAYVNGDADDVATVSAISAALDAAHARGLREARELVEALLDTYGPATVCSAIDARLATLAAHHAPLTTHESS